MSTYIRRRPDPSDRLSGNRWALLAIAFHLFVVVTRLSDALPGWQIAKVTLLLATALALQLPITIAHHHGFSRRQARHRIVRAVSSVNHHQHLALPDVPPHNVYVPPASLVLHVVDLLHQDSGRRRLHHLGVDDLVSSLAWVYLAAPPGVNVTGDVRPQLISPSFSAWVSSSGLGNALFAKGWQRWVAIGVIVTTLLGIVKTGSRAGFITLAAVGLYVLWRYRSRALVPGLLSIAAIALLVRVYAPADYWDRMSTIFSDNIQRTSQSTTPAVSTPLAGPCGWPALKLILSNPILGVGAGAYEVGEGLSHQGTGKWSAAHNSFIQVGAELGVPGLVAFVWFVARGFTNSRHAARAMRRRQLWPRYQWLPEALTLSLLAYVVAGFSLSQGYSIMLYTLLAVATALRAMAEEHHRTGPTV